MSLNPEWNFTCRICLREGEFRSLFEICPESKLSYCAKVMQCSSVVIRQNDSLPEIICTMCIRELDVAYRFRINCESSDAILQSYREATVDDKISEIEMDENSNCSSEIQIPISSDVMYSYKPPSGLNVKLVSRGQAILRENNGETIIYGRPRAELIPVGVERVDCDESSTADEPESPPPPPDDDDVDSLITYDDALPPLSFRMESADEVQPGTDEGTVVRSELINELGVEEHTHTVDSGKTPDDSSVDMFFVTELVDVDKEDDLLDELASIKREQDEEDWEVLCDEEDSKGYFRKFPQVRATKTLTTGRLGSMQVQSNLIKTIQTIRKANVPNEEKPTIENIITKPGPDGSLETVIRVKRNLKTPKQRHVCKLCQRSYKYKHALETHLRRHRGDKPYKCTDCDKAFVVPFELRRHMRTHTGAKPYKCKYCERQFSDFGSKIKHERTHTGERPYTCDVCDKSFTYSHVLNSHMLIHTGVKKYSCPNCGKRFTKSHHLKAHLNTHVRPVATGSSSSVSKSSLRTESKGNRKPAAHVTKNVSKVEDGMLNKLDQTEQQHSNSNQRIEHRSAEFGLDDPTNSTDGSPFGQLVNISDYMISAKGCSETASIGAIMADDEEDVGAAGSDAIGEDDDPLLNVVTVLTANQVAGLVDGDYGSIRIVNGSTIKLQYATTQILSDSDYNNRLMRTC
ncbi:zinc finger protein with KRAB and SCAN domains 3-like [Wyeomyia smithii]|uniref:zinc finger protein with KRAB and SCAN domains 3-like n=1 Tax=Wyeomyia smithii TaxID=174621 RepID=UPI002467D35D|nr:zinc finger protein with KRAB and SCAN domains 3-like [Wyeomyia smithii]